MPPQPRLDHSARFTLTVALLASLGQGTTASAEDTTSPPGIVSFFSGSACPDGWSDADFGAGRLLLGYTNTTAYSHAKQVGTALTGPSLPGHKHGITGTVDVGSKGVAGDSGSNHKAAEPDDQSIPHSGDPTPMTGGKSNVAPMVQQRLCWRDDASSDAAAPEPEPEAEPAAQTFADRRALADSASLGDMSCSYSEDGFPQGTLAFFRFTTETTPTCPSGWSVAQYDQGYRATWSGSEGYIVVISFDGKDKDGDGVLRGRGSNWKNYGGGKSNEISSWNMDIWQGSIGGTLLKSYDWPTQQGRSNFNFNYCLGTVSGCTADQVVTGGGNTSENGLNAGIAGSNGSDDYDFYNDSSTLDLKAYNPEAQLVSTSTGTPGADYPFTIAPQPVDADGFFLVPFAPPVSAAGQVVGTGLADGEQRTHTHGYASSIDVSDHKFALDGGSRHFAHDGTHSFSGTSNAASSAVPYIQLLLCQKCYYEAGAIPGELDGVIAFYNGKDCPSNWTATSGVAGRFIVGLPDGAANGATFGSGALSPLAVPKHTHNFSDSVRLEPKGVSADNGCGMDICTKHIGLADTYDFSGTTDDGGGHDLPYMAVSSCTPE